MKPADGMLHLLKANPTLLPPAPETNLGPAIEHRRKAEVHACLRCPERARVAYVAHLEIGNRWLDLCPACDYWVRSNMSTKEDAHWDAIEARLDMDEGLS